MKLVVAAAAVRRGESFLVTRRPAGVHLAGCWEFPGGKCEAGESIVQCLERELREELGAAARIGAELLTVTHDYAERTVELHFLECELEGDPSPLLGQEMRWVQRSELSTLEFPPADADLIRHLARL
jgi:8-oxo-dGTP diphosphatase